MQIKSNPNKKYFIVNVCDVICWFTHEGEDKSLKHFILPCGGPNCAVYVTMKDKQGNY